MLFSSRPGSRATFHTLVGPGTPSSSPSDSRPDLWARAGAPGAGHSPLTPRLQVLSWPEPQDEPQAPALSRLTPQVNSRPSKFSSAATSSRKPRGKLSAYKPQHCSSGPPRPWSSPQSALTAGFLTSSFLSPLPQGTVNNTPGQKQREARHRLALQLARHGVGEHSPHVPGTRVEKAHAKPAERRAKTELKSPNPSINRASGSSHA